MKKFVAVILAVVMLSACFLGCEKKTDTKTYSMITNFNVTTLDYVYNNKSSNGDYTNNFIEGLLTQDSHGKLVPGMATAWEANADCSVWTFTIRDNAKWITSAGEEYAPVTAQDFVTGLKHAADSKSQTMSLVQDLIAGLNDYYEGTGKWEDVGIKVEGNKLTYTLTGPCGYFDGMTTYSILYPINAEFLAAQGDKFGAVEPSAILYNGCFILKSIVSQQEVKFDKNEKYWDKDNVFIDHVKVTYTDGSDTDQNFDMFVKGEVSSTSVMTSRDHQVEVANKKFKDNQYKSMTTSTSFWGAFNFDRVAYTLADNPAVVTTSKNDAQKADAKKAILNQNFRLAVYAAYSTKAVYSLRRSPETALDSARNTLVPYTFAALSDGTAYGKLVEQYLGNLVPEFKGIDLNDGQDAWYNVERAKAFAAKAKAELTDVTFPIILDYPVNGAETQDKNEALAMKKSIEDAIGDTVQINLVYFKDEDEFYASFYDVDAGDENAIDLAFSAGWGPDYGDPLTYINCFNAENGDMLNYSGINIAGKGNGQTESQKAALTAIGLYDVLEKLNAAKTKSGDDRIRAFAEIEAILLGNGILRPFATSGANLALSRVKPFTAAYGLYGQASYNVVPYFKYMQLSDTVIKADDYYAAKEKWLKGE